MELVNLGHDVGGAWVDEGCWLLLGLAGSQDLEDELSMRIGDELQIV